MIGTSNSFAHQQKSEATYLDVAANDHDQEKGLLVQRALARVADARPHIVEIGPGGGAAVTFLASQLEAEPHDVRLTLIEAPGITSHTLTQAINRFNTVGTCALVRGWAQDIATLVSEPIDVISASALLHEVYSYGGAYSGLHTMIRTFPSVLKPYGFFVYRDVYAVDAPSLHEPAVQYYSAPSWLQFLRLFLPHYLHHGTHPYHHHDDEVIVRQNSRIVAAPELDHRVCAVIPGCSVKRNATTSRCVTMYGVRAFWDSRRYSTGNSRGTGSISAPVTSACTLPSPIARGCRPTTAPTFRRSANLMATIT